MGYTKARVAGAPGRRHGHKARRLMVASPVLAGVAGLAGLTTVLTAAPATAQAGHAGHAGHTPAARPAAARLLTAAWGANETGQLGFTTAGDFSAVPGPVRIPAGMTLKRVRGGCGHAVAVTTSGRVLTWGSDDQGQLGDGQAGGMNPRPRVVTFPRGTPRITSVAASCSTSFALTAAGQVMAWGGNAHGELGGDQDGGQISRPARVGLPPGVRVTAISAGNFFGLALTSGGQVYAWGDNSEGQLGDNDQDPDRPAPAQVSLPGGARATMIAAGGNHALARTGPGRLLAWGADQEGELGDGGSGHSAVPVPVLLPPGARVTGLSAGSHHSVALLGSGQVLAWGSNTLGQLGDGSGHSSARPVRVHLPGGTRAQAVAAGLAHTIVITTTGRLLGWGGNSVGEVGDGSTANRPTPVPVSLNVPRLRRQHRPPFRRFTAVVIGAGPEATSSYVVYRGRP